MALLFFPNTQHNKLPPFLNLVQMFHRRKEQHGLHSVNHLHARHTFHCGLEVLKSFPNL